MTENGQPTRRLSADDCRRQADECRGLARLTTKSEHRLMLEHMAGTWERIAADMKGRE